MSPQPPRVPAPWVAPVEQRAGQTCSRCLLSPNAELSLPSSCIVTGDVKGRVKFYNGRLQLLACYSHSGVGPICSISFSKPPPEPPDASSACSSASSQPFTTG